jgi:outer membrane autotransporter protein
LYATLPSMARQYLWIINGTLEDRRGSAYWLSQQGFGTDSVAWGRVIAQSTEFEPGSFAGKPSVSASTYAVQFGVDAYRARLGQAQLRVGPVLTLGRSSGQVQKSTTSRRTGDVSLNAYSLGLNATLNTDSGSYVDVLVQATRLTGGNATSVQNTQINTQGWGYSGSIEAGWRHSLTQKFSVTPQAQLFGSRVTLNNSGDAYSLVSMPAQDSLIGRLGLMLAYDQSQTKSERTRLWGRVSLLSTLAGQNSTITFSNLAGTNPQSFQSQVPSTWLGLDAGLDIQTSRNTSVFLGLGYQTSFDGQFRGVTGQANLRIAF